MILKLRNGQIIEKKDGQQKILSLLYGTLAGRLLLKPLIRPWLSRLGGRLLSTGASRVLICPFIRSAGIRMEEYEPQDYKSYNDFFSRRIRKECRPVDMDPAHLISPCDSKLTVLPVTKDCRFTLKNTSYTVASLLRDETLASRYTGGWAMIFRLAVDDYHRYCYAAQGHKGENVRIPGVFHTVNPIANDHYPIYKENTREYTVLSSRGFGDILVMEVGALMVGKIVNHHGEAEVLRGQEKGYFQFGGSTIVMLLEPGRVIPDADILENSRQGVETVVHFGENIGISCSKN